MYFLWILSDGQEGCSLRAGECIDELPLSLAAFRGALPGLLLGRFVRLDHGLDGSPEVSTGDCRSSRACAIRGGTPCPDRGVPPVVFLVFFVFGFVCCRETHSQLNHPLLPRTHGCFLRYYCLLRRDGWCIPPGDQHRPARMDGRVFQAVLPNQLRARKCGWGEQARGQVSGARACDCLCLRLFPLMPRVIPR